MMAWLKTQVLQVPDWLRARLGKPVFDAIMQLQGQVFRDVPGRKTIRCELDGKAYFIKQHFGVGWGEIFKNLSSLRWPIISAATEWQAIQKLGEVGIPTTPGVAYGWRGLNPASRQSFVVTRDLGDIISLETLCAPWADTPPDPAFKRRLILEVARLARLLHDNGMNHRDFYICHFCLDQPRWQQHNEIYLYLIDLHRVGIRSRIPPVARMKDIAALYFSAMNIGLTRRDIWRFLRAYRAQPLRQTWQEERAFLEQVAARAQRLYVKFHGKMPSQLDD
jgi:heptose I phosphotransferase